ncbi:MAG TPA: hypothetical protein V6C81_29345 [Planktothrix sp.]|jgi:hypothetical protein
MFDFLTTGRQCVNSECNRYPRSFRKSYGGHEVKVTDMVLFAAAKYYCSKCGTAIPDDDAKIPGAVAQIVAKLLEGQFSVVSVTDYGKEMCKSTSITWLIRAFVACCTGRALHRVNPALYTISTRLLWSRRQS